MTIVVVATTAVAVTTVASIGLTSSVSKSHSKHEKKLQKEYVAQGAIELATSDVASGVLELGQSKSYTIGGVTVTVTANDNSGNVPGTVSLAVNGSAPNMPITASKTVAYAEKRISNIWAFGVYSNGGFAFPLLGSSKVTGSTFFRSSISILGTGQITKDYKSTSSFNPLGLLNIGGTILTGVTPLAFPSLSDSTYQSAAATVLTGNQTLNGYSFARDGDLLFVNGNLNIQGTIAREGSIYVTGSVTVNGNLQAQSGKKFAIISPGNITFDGSGSAITAEGYYFSRGTVYLTDKLTLNGALVGNSYSVGSNFTITWDKWATDKAANGAKLKLPMMWP